MRENIGKVKGHVAVHVRRSLGIDKDGNHIYGDWKLEAETDNLVCTNGRDFLHDQCYKASGAATVGAAYIALTTDAAAAAAGDTVLASEISTNGLERAIGAYAHTPGTNTSTVSKTFTASGTHTAVVKSGLFTAAISGTMVHEAVFSPSVNLASGDQLAITWTITLG